MATDSDCGLWESFTEEGTSERILKDKNDFEELNSSTIERFRRKGSIKLYLHFYSG